MFILFVISIYSMCIINIIIEYNIIKIYTYIYMYLYIYVCIYIVALIAVKY